MKESAAAVINAVSKTRPNVFQSLDYRLFMQDMFEFLKSSTRAFSNRSLAKRDGFKSSGFFINVVSGRKSLSVSGAAKVANGLKLSTTETDYFVDLTAWSIEPNCHKKHRIFKKLMSSRAFHERDPLKTAQLNYFSDFRMPIVREMILAGAKDRASILDCFLLPLAPEGLNEILKTLVSLELISESEKGLEVVNRAAHTLADCPSPVLKTYHQQMIEKGADALETVDRTLRDIQALALSIDPNELQILNSTLYRFLSDLATRFEMKKSKDRVVYQVNIQAFPLSKPLL
jgi:uncharacterized protein (TIGR02147 family)